MSAREVPTYPQVENSVSSDARLLILLPALGRPGRRVLLRVIARDCPPAVTELPTTHHSAPAACHHIGEQP